MPTHLVMLMCRCHECRRQQTVRADASDPVCGACGGDLAVDAKYHPNHPAAAVFDDGQLDHMTPTAVIAREKRDEGKVLPFRRIVTLDLSSRRRPRNRRST